VLDRVSLQDVGNLRIERRGQPMHVAALLMLEARPLCDAGGTLRLDALRAHIEHRLHLAPRLRQMLFEPPFGLGRPVWVDDPSFDISEHVRARAVPAPGGEADLVATCLALNEPPLARSRPLWELWFLTGLDAGTVGMLIRSHHVIADGVATVAMLAALMDGTAEPQPVTAPSWAPAPRPSDRDLKADSVRRRRLAVRRAFAWLSRPAAWRSTFHATLPALRASVADGLGPRTSLNVPVGRRRDLRLVRADLACAKAAAHGHGAKVNDVVLASVAGGARELLASRGEPVHGLVLRASVPVSLRASGEHARPGNRVGLMVVPLPVGEPDAALRLERIARSTTLRKRRPRSTSLGPLPGPDFVQRFVVGLMNHQRVVNLFTSDVPGPPVTMYFAGARIIEMFQIPPNQGNVTISVGALSYAGQLGFGVVGDADACRDLAIFARGLARSLDELGALRLPDASATRGAAIATAGPRPADP
jgi:WS/DGAT/MGAT family acyltransferase